MGYMHINNLYKAKEILAFKEVYAMEKIHGTSAHLRYALGQLYYFSGGENHEKFKGLFNEEGLKEKFAARFDANDPDPVVIYGEAYGGKQQGMSKVYGPALKFVAFDVKVGENWWFQVEQAEEEVKRLGLEFVDYVKVPCELEALDFERDKPSTQAKRNGVEGDQLREGIVIRPPFEVLDTRGGRIMAKHKGEAFGERANQPRVGAAPSEVLEAAAAIALEWVTPMRLEHVIGTLISGRDEKEAQMSDTGSIIRLMVEDVLREGEGEIVDSKESRKAIGARAAALYKKRVTVM